MRQTLIAVARTNPSQTAQTYAALTRVAFNTVEFSGTQPFAASGTLRNLLVTTLSAPGAGKSLTYTIRINGVDSALTVTLSDADLQQRDTTHAVTIAAGDTVSIHTTPGGGGAGPLTGTPHISLDFDSDNPGESVYGFATTVNLSNSVDNFNGVFMGTAWGATATVQQNVVAALGSLTALYARLAAAPGAGNDYTLLVMLNGVAQDGSGGTVDTRVVISGTATTGSATFTLPLVAGDVVELRARPTSSPLAVIMQVGSRFLATTDGESQLSSSVANAMSTTATNFAYGGGLDNTGWNSSETSRAVRGGITPITLKRLQVVCTVAPGAAASGKSRTFSYRKNAATPSGAPSAQVLETAVAASDLTSVITVLETDLLGMREVPANTPASSNACFTAIQVASVYPDIPACFPFMGGFGGGSFIGIS